MLHTRVLGVGKHNCALWFLKDGIFGDPSDLYACLPRIEFFKIGYVLGWQFSQVYFFFDFARSRLLGDPPHARSRCRDA